MCWTIVLIYTAMLTCWTIILINSHADLLNYYVNKYSHADVLNYYLHKYSHADPLNYYPHKYSHADVLNYYPHKHSHAHVLNYYPHKFGHADVLNYYPHKYSHADVINQRMVPLLKNIRTEIGASCKLHCSLSLSKTTECTGYLEPRAAFSSSVAIRTPCPIAPQIQAVLNESSGHSLKSDEHAHSPHTCPISPWRQLLDPAGKAHLLLLS